MTIRLVYTQMLVDRTIAFCDFGIISDKLMTTNVIAREQ